MKRNNKIILLCVAMMMMALQSFAVVKPTKLYAYGFAASFNDSTVYITDIMELDSAWIDVKTGFLYSRENYSYQLKQHLITQGVKSPTCIISFSAKRKDAEKKYMKLRKKYTKVAGQYTIKPVTEQEFKFNCISAIGDPNANTNYTKESIKAEEKAMKAARKEAKEKAIQAKREAAEKRKQQAAKNKEIKRQQKK